MISKTLTTPSATIRIKTIINKLVKTIFFLIFAIVCMALLASCQRDQEHSAELFVFGTIVEIKLWGATPEEASDAFSELQEMFQGMHRDWHAWEPGRLTDINKAFEQGQSATADNVSGYAPRLARLGTRPADRHQQSLRTRAIGNG